MGRGRVGGHRLQSQRQGVRLGRGTGEPAARGRVPLRLRRRRVPQAQLGRLLRERVRHGRQGVNGNGDREVIGCAEGFTESKDSWKEFLLWLRGRGLAGVRMVTGDKSLGMLGALEEVFPQAKYQRCTVHFYRNVFGKVPRQKRERVAKMLKAIHAQESFEASMAKAESVASDLEAMKLGAAAKVVREGCAETLTYTAFPMSHWVRIRTNNAIERLNREIRRRTRVVGTFPDGKSALMLVAARLKHIAESEWGSRRYLDVSMLKEVEA